MEISQQEVKEKQKPSQNKVGGHSKKSSNKPNPTGGKSRAKSTLLASFEKNLKANSQSSTNSNKIQVVGFDSEKFKNLKAMFEKKPSEITQEELQRDFESGKINPERFKAFGSNKQNEETKNELKPLKDVPRMSIQDRINMLMKSKDETEPKKTLNDPILNRLREVNLEEEEDSDNNYSQENLDISREEENNNDIQLDKSESLSDESDNEKNKYDEEKDKNDNINEGEIQKDKRQNKKDLNKSESLDD